MAKYVTLVGSRKILETDSGRALQVANLLNKLEYIGRSGGAPGMDDWWDVCMNEMNIFLPHNGFNGKQQGEGRCLALELAPKELRNKAKEIMMLHHPYGYTLRGFALRAHTRNVFQALGSTLEHPSELTVYAAPENKAGKVTGGTSTAVEVSRSYGIPTFNIRIDSQFKALIALLEEKLNSRFDNA